MSNAADLPSTSELVEGALFYPIALVITATICPGLTLCIPGLIFVAVLVLIPLVAMAIVVVVAAALVAAPVVAVRGIRGLGRRRAASKEVRASASLRGVVSPPPRGRPPRGAPSAS